MRAGVIRLSFAHHVNHLDPTQDRPSGCHRLEPGRNPPLDGAVVLFDAIVQICILPYPDRRQLATRLILEPVCGVTGQDGLAIGLAAIKDISGLRNPAAWISIAIV